MANSRLPHCRLLCDGPFPSLICVSSYLFPPYQQSSLPLSRPLSLPSGVSTGLLAYQHLGEHEQSPRWNTRVPVPRPRPRPIRKHSISHPVRFFFFQFFWCFQSIPDIFFFKNTKAFMLIEMMIHFFSTTFLPAFQSLRTATTSSLAMGAPATPQPILPLFTDPAPVLTPPPTPPCPVVPRDNSFRVPSNPYTGSSH